MTKSNKIWYGLAAFVKMIAKQFSFNYRTFYKYYSIYLGNDEENGSDNQLGSKAGRKRNSSALVTGSRRSNKVGEIKSFIRN